MLRYQNTHTVKTVRTPSHRILKAYIMATHTLNEHCNNTLQPLGGQQNVHRDLSTGLTKIALLTHLVRTHCCTRCRVACVGSRSNLLTATARSNGMSSGSFGRDPSGPMPGNRDLHSKQTKRNDKNVNNQQIQARQHSPYPPVANRCGQP